MVPSTSPLRQLPHDRPRGTLLVTILFVEIVGASGAVFTSQGLDSWYDTLTRPELAPPNWVFSPVWITLFALMGIALWLVWRRAIDEPRKARIAVGCFVVHFALNIGWSAVFFGMREIGWALTVIGLLWGAILVVIWAFARVDRRAALLLVPYLLWVSFAAYLNFQFWVLN